MFGVNGEECPMDRPEKLDRPRGSRFAQARKTARLTLDKVAGHFEVNRSTVLRWERGADPKKVDANEIAALYGVRAAWLMHDDGPMRGEAAFAATRAPEPARSKSEPKLAIAHVEGILARARASQAERAAAWARLRTAEADDPTEEWLRGWIDGFRSSEPKKGAGVVRQISSLPPKPKR